MNAVSDKEDDDPFGDEELDPRVQVELEKLNACTDEINKVKYVQPKQKQCSIAIT